MKIKVQITGCIDVPDSWNEKDIYGLSVYDIADYHFDEKLREDNAIDELARLLKRYPEDYEFCSIRECTNE